MREDETPRGADAQDAPIGERGESIVTLLVPAVVFVVAAVAVYLAGVLLSDTTDILTVRWGLGEELGGLVLLAIVTNLPEVVITTSAALGGTLSLAIGNILGGVAIQVVVLVYLDVVVGDSETLTYRAASLVLVLEGLVVIVILLTVIAGSQLPETLVFERVTPPELLIALLWVGGIWLVSKARTGLPWHGQGTPPDAQLEPRGVARREKLTQIEGYTATHTLTVFLLAAGVTLAGGIALERSSSMLADGFGVSGAVFGATVLAAVTSLPEISTGAAAVRLGDYQLAVSDIFGGNAFLPVLFLLASVLSGNAVLPALSSTNIYLACLGGLLTAVYLAGLIFRPRYLIARLGLDSLVVLVLYLSGILGLAFIVAA
ncbi:sodium:calcium antiporter [Haloprofundus halobius]|uniref:sodium:calcium antiporter n=1 Tax=Haloprofundus halobius TaxID=2876194 RepID=UPI001CCEC022|nr:hypothetical protein [Haloprofundus halobius]